MSKTKETRTVRECTTTWDYNDDDELKSKEIRVRYFSPTIAQLKRDRIEEEKRIDKDPTSLTWLSDILSKSIHSLNDLPGTPTSVMKPSIEWLDEQDLRNLKNVRDAIDEDLSAGKSRPAK